MGLFGNLISNAVSEGLGKGIQDAVGKAVESAVKPAADKLAGQAANKLNQAAQSMAESGEAAKEATGTGAANLEAALTGWASAMQNVAGQVAQNVKECPQCGEVVTADHQFCPKCGAKLPDKTLGEGYLCPKCGRQNAPGMTYCAECGALLPAAEAESAAQLAGWDALLPQYPKWTLGGAVELEADGETVRLCVGGAGAAQLGKYVELLKADGFVSAYSGDSDVYYKVVDGVCRAFDKTDAAQGDSLSMTFFVGDYDKRAAAEEKADAALGKAKDGAKLAADAAKGLFRKFF